MAKKVETKKPAAKKPVVEEPVEVVPCDGSIGEEGIPGTDGERFTEVKKSEIDLAITEIKKLKVSRRKVAKTLALLDSLANVLK